MNKKDLNVNRRLFLQGSVLGTVAAGFGSQSMAAEEDKKGEIDPKKIKNYNEKMRYRRVPKTDIYLSVISLGGLVNVPAVNKYAIEHGVNLCHMSTSYMGGRSLVDLGKVMKTHRDKVYLALKDNFLPKRFKSVDDDIKKFKEHGIFENLNTDYIDFLMFNRHDADEIDDENIPARFEALKKRGIIRYAGLTTHGDVKGCVAAGVEHGLFRLIMPTFKQSNLELLDEELKIAVENEVGFMPMKTMGGLNTKEVQLAYLKKVLRNPAVVTVNKGIGSFDMFDDWAGAVRETLTSMEDQTLYRYAQSTRSENCMMCDECYKACPNNIRVSTVIRCKDYYYEQMRDWDTAYTTYHSLKKEECWNEQCEDCWLCKNACPNQIQIVPKLNAARSLFA